MAIPRVSHRNWERLRGVVQIGIGTERVDAGQLPFTKRLETVLPDEVPDESEEGPGTYREQVAEFKFGEKDPDNYSHTDWEEGVEVEVNPGGRKRSHRPHVPEELVERLKEVVQVEYPNVPVESYSFDDLLGIYLDRVLEYYQFLDCYLTGENYKGPTPTEE